MALQKKHREYLEILHTFVLQNDQSGGMSGYILKTFLDVTSPTGALVFVFVVAGIFAVFMAILDSLKPPNFPPGPRWLPFGGDSSGFCEKPFSKVIRSKLVDQFGPVVGLRRKKGPRNPLVLALDATSAQTVLSAAANGFLECASDRGQSGIEQWLGISPSLRKDIRSALLSENLTESIARCAQEAVCDLFVVLKTKPQPSYRCLIPSTFLAALLNLITGQRVNPTSSHLAYLYRVLKNNSKFNYNSSHNQWTEAGKTTKTAENYSKLIMVLSDLDELEMSKLTESSGPSMLNILEKNHHLISLPEKIAIIAEIFILTNIQKYLSVINEIVNISGEHTYIEPSDIFLNSQQHNHQTCYELSKSLIHNEWRRAPALQIGCRWKVLNSFYLNGFTVPQGSNVQSILNNVVPHVTSHLITESKSTNPEEKNITDLLSRVLGETVCCPEVGRKFCTALKMR